MPEVIDGIAAVVEQINQRVRELESRVAVLEGRSAPAASPSAPITLPPLDKPKPPATWRGFPPPEKPAGTVPVLGKAVLGIAGAYLLRAIAESGAVPKLPVLFVAILYARLWLVSAIRKHAANHFASTTYSVTSAMILAPLLWESTVRFQVLAPSFTAAVLVAFVFTAFALSWRGDLHAIPWVATLAGVITALALIVGTREFVAFTTALLGISLMTEVAACRGRYLRLRVVSVLLPTSRLRCWR
jgi:hypothetical protein